jgi:DNA polymerase elongation subunit (family B)
MKILILDIETAPNLAHVWGFWQQNVGLNQVIQDGYVLCWAAKWYNSSETMFRSIEHDGQAVMLKEIWDLIDEADVVVHYNGTKFDMPTLNTEFIVAGMMPPSPYKQVDLLKSWKQNFRTPSNKLEFVSKKLKIGQKIKHYGHELWIQCMNHVEEAWDTMKKYNIMDVKLTEDLYNRLMPWIKSHPNRNLYDGELLGISVCTNCGSDKLHKKGKVYTNASVFQRYRCTTCGANMRGRTNLVTKAEKKNVLLPLTT